MEITVNLSGKVESLSRVPADRNQAYKNLCEYDAQIRSLMMDQREALPAVIHLLDKEMRFPRMRHKQLCGYLGLTGVTGPFYEDHYLDNGVRKVFAGAT